ncbi:ATP-dependent RNA helicase dbp6 [Cryomyces antarcticus]
MASTLYKRYIPPKTPTVPIVPPVQPTPFTVRPSVSTRNEPTAKRKRDVEEQEARQERKEKRKKLKPDAKTTAKVDDFSEPKKRKRVGGESGGKKEDEKAHKHWKRKAPRDNAAKNEGMALSLEVPDGKRDVQKDQEGSGDEIYEDLPRRHKTVMAKFQKSTKSAGHKSDGTQDAEERLNEQGSPELHDLVPLPQPAPNLEPEYKPISTLPLWLANPISVSTTATTPFTTLGLDPMTVSHLEKKGYRDAFAVQSAVIPLLLPKFRNTVGDICVSAATGSGKTLAYVLPMVESLKHSWITKLRGLIVVPTRELVSQARKAVELCTTKMGLKVDTAVGTRPLSYEQDLLIRKGRRFDPQGYDRLQQQAKRNILFGGDEEPGEDDVMLQDAVRILPGHVPEYTSKVDILVCTPGRLVEHLQSTTGFNLDNLEWLVIDEADRLLDQSFQQWVDTVMSHLQREVPYDQMSAKDKVLSRLWHPKEPRCVKKVVLSATMTRDISKLTALKLRRPRLVVVEGTEPREETATLGAPDDGDSFTLPSTLHEYAVPVGDGADKPLYLLQLLQTKILGGTSGRAQEEVNIASDAESSVVSSSSSDTSDSDSSDDSSASSDSEASSRVLIFTSTNESATRLSHLLRTLHPAYAPLIGTLAKSSSSSATLRRFRTGRVPLLVASDRASRGLDIPAITHVINYDVPRSVRAYVHRVGRTARAGREGQAWTLFEEREGRWFWGDVARGQAVGRAGTVSRVRVVVEEAGTGVRARYEEALRALGEAVRAK